MSGEPHPNQIIIRKRKDDDEAEHHGGVWKLAFADFMTAMMAFFLVMWLINSTTKETKAAIVQYFNPVQLVNSSPNVKGLRDPTESGQGRSNQKTDFQGGAGKVAEPPAQGTERVSEATLHTDPLKALDEIEAREPIASQHEQAAATKLGDPFDRVQQGSLAEFAKEPITESSAHREADASQISRLREALETIILTESIGKRGAPQLSVTQTKEGSLISLTDGANFSMFNVGSIEPKPQLVRILAKIGQGLSNEAGDVEIRGHTDGRSYKSASYDNWRLSSDRANLANYMLQRGGLRETRIREISGFADRQLKTPNDPNADVNRRIEILIRREAR